MQLYSLCINFIENRDSIDFTWPVKWINYGGKRWCLKSMGDIDSRGSKFSPAARCVVC